MRWLAYLHFVHGSDIKCALTWSRLNMCAVNEKLASLIKEGGVPHSLRARLWPRLCGATKMRAASKRSYAQILARANEETIAERAQIERDILRTAPTNRCFSKVGFSNGARGLISILLVLFIGKQKYFLGQRARCSGASSRAHRSRLYVQRHRLLPGW